MKLYGALWSFATLHEALRNPIEPYGALWSFAKPYEALWSPVELREAL